MEGGALASSWADLRGSRSAQQLPAKKKSATAGKKEHDARKKLDVQLQSSTGRFEITFGDNEIWWIGDTYENYFTLSSSDDPADERTAVKTWRLSFVFSAKSGGIQITEKFMPPNSNGSVSDGLILDLGPDDFTFGEFYETELCSVSTERFPAFGIDFFLNKSIQCRRENKVQSTKFSLSPHMRYDSCKMAEVQRQSGLLSRFRLFVAKDNQKFSQENALKCLRKAYVEATDVEPLEYLSRLKQAMEEQGELTRTALEGKDLTKLEGRYERYAEKARLQIVLEKPADATPLDIEVGCTLFFTDAPTFEASAASSLVGGTKSGSNWQAVVLKSEDNQIFALIQNRLAVDLVEKLDGQPLGPKFEVNIDTADREESRERMAIEWGNIICGLQSVDPKERASANERRRGGEPNLNMHVSFRQLFVRQASDPIPEPKELWNSQADLAQLGLNNSQSNAVAQILAPRDRILLIHGPPGTGKTHTTACGIFVAFKSTPKNRKIVVTARTNQAVQNCCIHAARNWRARTGRSAEDDILLLLSNHESTAMLRRKEADPSGIDSKLYSLSLDYKRETTARNRGGFHLFLSLSREARTRGWFEATEEERKEYDRQRLALDDLVMGRNKVHFATLSLLASRLYIAKRSQTYERRFLVSHMFVDEAGQVSGLNLLVGWTAMNPEAVVLVGDPLQLPPYHTTEMSRVAFGVSPFEHLQTRGWPVCLLNMQYRAHKSIWEATNAAVYKKQVSTAPSAVDRPFFVKFMRNISRISFTDATGKDFRLSRNSHWFDMINSKSEKPAGRTSKRNLMELEFVKGFHECLLKIGISGDEMFILSAYQAHSEALIKQFKGSKTKAGNIDACQGAEASVVILSTAATDTIGFLGNQKRMNVATSRAKEAQFVIGRPKIYQKNPVWMRWVAEMMEMHHDYCIEITGPVKWHVAGLVPPPTSAIPPPPPVPMEVEEPTVEPKGTQQAASPDTADTLATQLRLNEIELSLEEDLESELAHIAAQAKRAWEEAERKLGEYKASRAKMVAEKIALEEKLRKARGD
ncbi:putative regulator of nonsense [Phaeomoniella chlamydospora]|uniref:Putative regulator of nonsense n=1 Tax=Phaeomoniella chlamydospora TaxID=158046 RepID=A0A0G2EA16_PHACM|nr:putative regulator of nonsense [Phaeomoniella chlamydospora]